MGEVPDEDEEDEQTGEDDELDVSDEDEFDDDEEKPKKMKEVTTHTWEKANADAAIWNRPKEEISEDGENATSWSHFDAEGNINFKSLVYIPTSVPFELKHGDFNNLKSAIKL